MDINGHFLNYYKSVHDGITFWEFAIYSLVILHEDFLSLQGATEKARSTTDSV